MPTINPTSGKVEYASGEALPTVGSQEYIAAQQGKIMPPASPATPKIVGSNDPLLGKQTSSGVMSAGNALTAPTNPNTGNRRIYQAVNGKFYYEDSGQEANIKGGAPAGSTIDPAVSSAYGAGMEGNIEAARIARDGAERSRLAAGLQYNADLASNNLKYGSLFNDLKGKYEHALSVAQQNAVSLNPYSLSRGATTADNFKERITENFNSAAAQLQQQADVAQQQLAAGNYKSYIEIQNNLEKVISDVATKNNSLMIEFTKQVEQAKQFGANQKNVWADNFRQQLTSIALDPKMVDDMVKNGTIYDDPTFQAGVNAGFSPEGVIDSMKAGSLALKKAQDLEIYRAAQLSLQNERLIQATDRQTVAQMASAAAARVNSTHMDLISKGITYGTPEYAQGLASASQGGTKPTQADRDRYAALDAVSATLPRLKEDINALGDNTQIWNIISTASKNPYSSEVTKFTAQMQGIATQIGRGVYGEGGRLSDDDVRRILASVGNGYQASNVREGLYNELLKKVVDAASTKLISDANAGVDVSNYAYTIKSIQDKIGTAKVGSGNDFESWWNSTYGN